MFSHIFRYEDLEVGGCSTNALAELSKLSKLSEKSRLEYEESKAVLDETNKEIVRCEEQLSIIESERSKLMSELAQKIHIERELSNRVKQMKNELNSIEFDLKKCSKMKISTADLETLACIKKKFVTYKNMLKIHFDYSYGPNSTTQKGYMYNRISKNLTYFEFNTDEKTAHEISEYLWSKVQIVSDKNWDTLGA